MINQDLNQEGGLISQLAHQYPNNLTFTDQSAYEQSHRVHSLKKQLTNENQYYNYNNEQYYYDDYQFKSNFPRLFQYDNEEEIQKTFASCKELNSSPYSKEVGYYFLIKSNCDQNIHKSIKYGIWTSSQRTNETLSNAFEDAEKHGVSVLLIFTSSRRKDLIGIAEMKSNFNPGMSFKYWFDENKWFGSFKVNWIYIKSIPYTKINDLSQFSYLFRDGNKIGYLKDGQEIQLDIGAEILKRFENTKMYESIFYDFYYFDIEEDEIRNYRDSSEEFGYAFKQMSMNFAKTSAANPKKKFNEESESFTPLAIRQYEAKENKTEQNMSIEERFTIKSVEGAKKEKKKLKKPNKKKGAAEEEFYPKTRVVPSNEFDVK